MELEKRSVTAKWRKREKAGENSVYHFSVPNDMIVGGETGGEEKEEGLWNREKREDNKIDVFICQFQIVFPTQGLFSLKTWPCRQGRV